MHTRLLAILLLPLLLLTGACASLPPVDSIAVPADGNTIWFVYRDWHTSVLVDGADFRRLSRQAAQHPALAAELERAVMVRVGWGDGDYFTGKGQGAGTATRALFASGYSAMQYIGYESDPMPTIDADTRVPLIISDDGLAALVAYIDASLATNDDATLHQLPSYVANAGVFFESSTRYGLFNNCNNWSGEALRSAGLPVSGGLRLGPGGVFEQARFISNVQAGAIAAVAGP